MPSKRTNDSVDRILQELSVQQTRDVVRDSVNDRKVDEILRSVGLDTDTLGTAHGGLGPIGQEDLPAVEIDGSDVTTDDRFSTAVLDDILRDLHQTGYAIYQGLEAREATGNNLITVAERYTSQNPELTSLIGDLEYAISLTQNSYSDFSDEAQANQLMGDAAQNLYEELKQTELSESDEKYPDQLIAEMESEQDKINRSSYNDDAREFNARLEKFPVNLLRFVAGVEPLATYDLDE